MNKLMMTPAGPTGRSATADLLSLNGLGRPSPDVGDSPEASGGFARLLQANANASAQARSAALTMPPAPPSPAPAQPRAAAKAPEHPEADASTGASRSESPRSQDATRAAQRRSADGSTRSPARRAGDAEPAPADDSTDPVLAQMLRHLRGHAGATEVADGSDTPGEQDSSTQDAVDDVGTVTDPVLAQMQGTAAQPLPPGSDTTLRAQSEAAEPGLAMDGLGSAKDLALSNEAPGPDALSADAELRHWRDARAADRAEMRATGATANGQPAVSQPLADRPQTADAATGVAEALQGLGQTAAAEDTPLSKSDALTAPPGSFAGILHQAQAGAVADKASAERLTGTRYELQSPLHSTGFAPEMAARLSLAAADGVQQAQLHLNPAEMGPVQVQIVLDGQQAQISFVAEQADTRAVLEKSLPELAGALREQGLTLSGGGVFSQQQAPQDPNAQADAQGGRSGPRWSSARVGDPAIEDPAALRVQAPATRSRGVLDLFA